MNTAPTHDPDVDGQSGEELLIHAWRSEQLRGLGLPPTVADAFADSVDWHDLAALTTRGCPLGLALEIVR